MSAPDPTQSPARLLRPGRRSRATLWKAALTLAVFAGLFAFLPRDVLVEALRRTSPALFAGVIGGLALGHVVAAQKWRLLLRACGAHCTPVEALQAHGAGLFANLCMPSLVGGDVVRAAFVARGAKSLPPIAVASLGDRLIDTAGLLLLAGLGALAVPGALPAPTLPVVVGGLGVFALGIATGPRLLRALPSQRLPERLRGVFDQLLAAVGNLEAHPGAAALATVVSVAVQAGFVLLNALLGRALGIEVPVAVWFVAWPLAKIIALAPVSLGGLGVREAALAGLLAGFGVEPARAVAESLVWQGALISLGLISGAAAFGSRRLTHGGPAGEIR